MEDPSTTAKFWQAPIADLAQIIGHDLLECPVSIKSIASLLQEQCRLDAPCQQALEQIILHNRQIDMLIRRVLFGMTYSKGILEVRLLSTDDQARASLPEEWQRALPWALSQPLDQAAISLAELLLQHADEISRLAAEHQSAFFTQIPPPLQPLYDLMKTAVDIFHDSINTLLRGILAQRIKQELVVSRG